MVTKEKSSVHLPDATDRVIVGLKTKLFPYIVTSHWNDDCKIVVPSLTQDITAQSFVMGLCDSKVLVTINYVKINRNLISS